MLALLLGMLVAAVVAAPPARALGGTLASDGHTLTWNVSGVSAVPSALRAKIASNYEGIVMAGRTVTLSGSMAYSIGPGFVTNLSQYASIGGGKTSPTKSFSKRVGGETITTPFSLTTTLRTAREYGASGLVLGYLSISVSSRNCNDWGVCGGPSVSKYFAVLNPAVVDLKPPTVGISGPAGIVRVGQKVPVKWWVNDNSGKAAWWIDLYSGGTKVSTTKSNGYMKTGSFSGYYPSLGQNSGPYFLCIRAKDRAGNTSAHEPRSACARMSIQVRMPLVSNGCGPRSNWLLEKGFNWVGNIREFGGIPVNIAPACNVHDAGYTGATVGDPFTKTVIDFRTWSRQRVDLKFLRDIKAQCTKSLPKSRPALVKACHDEAYIYFYLVRDFGASVGGVGKRAYDADATTPGSQTIVPTSTRPAGGARDNT